MIQLDLRPSLLLLAAALAWGGPARAGELTAEATAEEQGIAGLVTALVEEFHISKGKIDDEKSARALRGFLQALDPAKVYFRQGDIASLKRFETKLDDQLRARDLSFAFTTIRLFLRRVDETLPLIDELVAAEHDFTLDESITLDPELLDHPASDAEARERWRKRIKFEVLRELADGASLEEAREKIQRRYHRGAKRWHKTDNSELLELYLTALTLGFDPHSTYMGPRTLENFEITMSLELEGIGAELRSEDGYTTVSRVLPGGAAARDGRLAAGDRIVAVGQGGDEALTDVVEWKLSDVVQLIRGERGTRVRLAVLPAAGGERALYVLTRDRVELKEAEAAGEVFEVGAKADGAPFKVGVIALPSFYRDMAAAERGQEGFRSTTRDVRALLERFEAGGVDALVLDLRLNGGGSLIEAVELTGLFIDQGPVVQVKSFASEVRLHNDTEPGTAWDGPLVVLTSKLSASASEILAGAIQDYQRGVVVGDAQTHGKGSVQQLLDLRRFVRQSPAPNLGALKLTIQKFYRPNGASTQSAGVQADVELPSLLAHLGVGEAELDHALAFDRVEPARYARAGRVDAALLARLRQRSAARIGEVDEFQRIRRRIERFVALKARKTSPLNRERFLAERREVDPDQELESLGEEVAAKQAAIERDCYLDEALEVAADLIRARDP